MPVSDQCFAYKILKKQIGQQCKIHGKLHKREDLGKLPGMYVPNEEGRDIPSDATSAFFRGGIINTMACFEGYVLNLLDEASDTILYERKRCPGLCEDCKQLKYDHVVTTTPSGRLERAGEVAINSIKKKSVESFNGHRKNPSSLHDINEVYNAKFHGISFIKELLSVGQLSHNQSNLENMGVGERNECSSFKYFYQMDSKKISAIEFKDEAYLCAMMRLFYGLRCIMAHGSSKETHTTGVLKDFPYCPRQECDNLFQLPGPVPCRPNCQKPICKLTKCAELNGYFNDCIDERGKKKVLKTSRLYPKPQPLTKLKDVTKREAALELRQTYFPELDDEERDLFNELTELPENYALYHLLRIYTYLKENERDMYITYRVLVRINQFYLVLAYRMKIAVGRILIHKYGLPDGTWGIPKGKEELKQKIEKFEEKHRETVISLQKPVINLQNNNTNDVNKSIIQVTCKHIYDTGHCVDYIYKIIFVVAILIILFFIIKYIVL